MLAGRLRARPLRPCRPPAAAAGRSRTAAARHECSPGAVRGGIGRGDAPSSPAPAVGIGGPLSKARDHDGTNPS